MKVSFNWLRAYADFSWTPDELAHKLTMCGLEVEGVERFESLKGGLQGVVVGHVLTVVQHPNADRLRCCKVDVGAGKVLDIVCGAPNVAEGQKVPVALVGTTLYPLTGEPITLKESKIRGELSQGMICAEDELGVGESHAGILVLDPALTPGSPVAALFDVEVDHTLEIGLTANRVDAASHYGVARDIAALQGTHARLPEIPVLPPDAGDAGIAIHLPQPEACPYYVGIRIRGVQVAESPAWLRNRLKAIGLRPINNIVDITNFVLHELGQPLHAFDASRISGNRIEVKTLPADAEFTTLDGQVRKIRAERDLMICDGSGPVAVAGVMGGQNSEVDDTTTDIFLESAWFEPSYIRSTGRHLGIKTDAGYRFERGADPEMVLRAALRCTALIQELAGGTASAPTVVRLREFGPHAVDFDLDAARRMMGLELSRTELDGLFRSLDIHVERETGRVLHLSVPAYRVDVTRPQDVMEELLRIYGYNRVPLPETSRIFVDTQQRAEPHRLRQRWFDYLAANGWSEIIANPLIPAKYHTEGSTVRLLNNLSEDLAVLRPDLLRTGLDIVAWNLNRRNSDLRLFESGKSYHVDGEGYSETEWVAFYLTGQTQEPHWQGKGQTASIFTLVRELERMQAWMGVSGELTELTGDARFDYGVQWKGGGDAVLARLGKVSAAWLKEYEIKQTVLYAEVDWKRVWRQYQKLKVQYQELPKYPSIRRDISLLVPAELQYRTAEKAIRACNPKLIRSVSITDIYQGDKIEAGKKSYLLSLTLLDDQKTLTDEVADKLMNRIFEKLEGDLGATVRR